MDYGYATAAMTFDNKAKQQSLFYQVRRRSPALEVNTLPGTHGCAVLTGAGACGVVVLWCMLRETDHAVGLAELV